MNLTNWSLVLMDTMPGRKSRAVHLGKTAQIGIACCLLVIGFGLVRTLHFAGSLAYAKLGVYVLTRGNQELLQRISDLDRSTHEYALELEQLVAFEDSMRLRFGLTPISDDVRKAGVGGLPTVDEIVFSSLDPNIARADSLRGRIAVLDRKVDLQKATFFHMAEQVRGEYQRWSEQPSGMPTKGNLTSSYGYRFHPTLGARVFHEGIDIANKPGTPVFATAAGTVEEAGWQNEYGNTVVLRHPGSGLETAYAHLRSIAIDKGQKRVRRGELIGYMGSTGRSTGPHLHYEVRRMKSPLDPLRFILPTDIVVD